MKSDMESVTGWLFDLTRFGSKNGLGNIRELLSRLGDPQDSFRSIHVAGSDGKGSTCAFIESVLRRAGIRTGLFTSPHIVRPNERIRVCGIPVDDGTFIGLAERVRKVIDGMRADGFACTFFEAITAMAFLHFREAGTEYAVVEVGMGGRFDATNVIVPDVSVITNISLEHTKYLGDTIEQIAFEKAGIIKSGVPVVTCNTGAALEVIRARASEEGSELITVTGAEPYGRGCPMAVRYRGKEWRTGIPGSFQAVNSAMAYEALAHSSVWYRAEPSLQDGMASARWPARMQKIDGMPLIVDVTHTAAGMKALCNDVKALYGRTVTVFGVLDDKDFRHMAESVYDMSERVIVVTPESSRALPYETVLGAFRDLGCDAEPADSFAEAMDRAFAEAGGRNVLVTGSFVMAESAFGWLSARGHAHALDL